MVQRSIVKKKNLKPVSWKYFGRVMLIYRSGEVDKTYLPETVIFKYQLSLVNIFSFPRNMAITPQT